jgi:hypothetical protein
MTTGVGRCPNSFFALRRPGRIGDGLPTRQNHRVFLAPITLKFRIASRPPRIRVLAPCDDPAASPWSVPGPTAKSP